MRVASRHMPKFARRSMGPVGWLFIGCFLAGVLYLAITKPQGFLIVLSGLAALFWITRKQSQRKERKLLALGSQREGQTICEFVRDFDARVVDTWVIRAVYEQLQEQLRQVHPSFPVRADDRLNEDLLLDDDDVDMVLAREVATRTGRSIASTDNNPYFGKVKTVRELVLFFQHQPTAANRH